jgi:glycosyltransferase involved in cell wall biosynthesis
MPVITVLVPVKSYHPGYLREALDSALEQTSDAWRLLVLAEPEDKAELRGVVAEYLRDERISLIENRGRKLSGAFNTGMRSAQTEFVAILLGDDKWAPEAVEVLNREIEGNPEVDFFHSSRIMIDERGDPISQIFPSRPGVHLEHFGYSSPVKHLLCWRRSKALAFGGMDESLDSIGVDDFDFPWSMAEHGATFHAVPDCLYLYRDHRSSFRLTTHLPLSLHVREIQRIGRKHGAGRLATWRAVRHARRTYLRQCLFRSEWERWLREKLHRPPSPWRETYL